MANLFDLLGRILISLVFLLSGYNKILNFEGSASWMEGYGIPGFFLGPAIALEIIFPLLIIVGYRVQFSAIILCLFCIATGLIFHLDLSNQTQVIALLKNLGLAGGFLFIAVNGTKDWAFDKKKKYVRL